MKGPSDSNPWVPIVAGVLVLFAGGVLWRSCATRTASDVGVDSPFASKATKPEHAGWIAQPGTGGSDTEPHRRGTSGGRQAGDGEAPADAAPSGAGGDRGSGDFRDTDMADVDSDAIAAPQGRPHVAGAANGAVTAGGNAPPSAQSAAQAAKPNADTNAAAQTHDTAPVQDTAKTTAADSTAPVLSLPLDKSTESDQNNTAPIIASGVTFDQNGAHFAADAQLFIPDGGNVNPAAGTITFWILPDWAGEVQGKYSIVYFGAPTFQNHIWIFKDLAYLRFLFSPDSGYESGASQNITNWRKGDRHMVTSTWGDGVTAMYIDGNLVGEHDYDGALDLGPNPPLILGNGGTSDTVGGANSNIRNFQIYAYALGADEVAALYAQPPS